MERQANKQEITFVNEMFEDIEDTLLVRRRQLKLSNSLSNPSFTVGIIPTYTLSTPNQPMQYVVGNGFLTLEMLVYETYKQDNRFFATTDIDAAKQFLLNKVVSQIEHTKKMRLERGE